MSRSLPKLAQYAVAAAVGCAAAVAAHGEEFRDKITKSFNVQPGGTFSLDADYGHVDMKAPSNGSTVQVEVVRVVRADSKAEAQKIFDDLALDTSQSGNNVNVKGRFKTGWQPRLRRHSDNIICIGSDDDGQDRCLAYGDQLIEHFYVLTLPKKFNVNIETRAGHLNLKDIGGELNAFTRGGHVTALNVDGKATVDTAGGHIQLGNVGGPALLRTAGGHIGVGDVNGNLDAQTAGGHISSGRVKGSVIAKTAGGHIEIASASGTITAKTVGGGVSVRFEGQPKGDSSIETSAGSVNVELPEDVKLDVDAESNGGTVESDFILSPDRLERYSDSDRHWKRRTRSVSGKVNGGGPRLEVRNSWGSIHLRKASTSF